MNSAESFSSDYQAARAKFLRAAGDAGAALESITHPDRGPDGGELATDVAWIGPRDADAVLVTISATHGVEGFCGSGAQVDWLRREEHRRLPDGIAALIIHAINPYGFAWLRRVTNENVDLNRNWVDFNSPRPANPGIPGRARHTWQKPGTYPVRARVVWSLGGVSDWSEPYGFAVQAAHDRGGPLGSLRVLTSSGDGRGLLTGKGWSIAT